MTDIVAGRFEQQDDAHAAVERLLRQGFGREDVSSFFVNPPGQHARFPVGGDRNVSPGARGAGRAALAGAIIGTVLGLVFGLAASHIYGFASAIAGAVAGAYLGMLAGALARMQDSKRTPRSRVADATEPVRADFALLFDAVVAIDVIDHVAQPRRLLDAAIGLVKPGGLLVITAPYQGYAKNLALALTGRFDTRWEPLAEHGRMKFFSRETFGALLGEFELDDVCIRTVGRIPMFARSMIATARSPT